LDTSKDKYAPRIEMDISDATLIALGGALTIGSVIILIVVRWRTQAVTVTDTTVETIQVWK